MSNNFGLSQIAATQSNKHVTANDQVGQLDAALTGILSVEVDDTDAGQHHHRAVPARWSANPLGMLWPEIDAGFVTSGHNGGGDPPATARRPVVVIAAG